MTQIIIPAYVLIIFMFVMAAAAVTVFTTRAKLKLEIRNMDARLDGIRSRITNIEGEHTGQRNAYRDIINDITELKALVFNPVFSTPVELDWEKLTTKLESESNTLIQDGPIHKQYQQAAPTIDHRKMKAKDKAKELAAKYPHYYVNVEGLEVIDFYRLALLYNITDPCIQHAVKKLLAIGNRGHKNRRHDINDVIDSLQARLRIMDEDGIE